MICEVSMQLQQSPEAMLKTCSWGVAMFERPSQRMSAAVGTNPSCIAQESPLLMCSLQTHLFQDSVSPRDLYSVRTAASLPPSAVLHTFQKWSQWVDLALRLRKSKRHFSCFWHEKDNVGHRLPSRSFKILFKKKNKHKHKKLFQKASTNTKFHRTSLA